NAPALATATLAKSSVKRGGSLQVAFRPTESGTLKIEVQSLTKGRKKGKACKAKAKKGKRCTIVKTVRTQVVATSAGAGSAKVALKGLKAGRYQVRLTPTDGAGNRGAAKTIAFKIKK
ncbi:MAG: hypothetical protein JHC95_22875, partial [Solirubrobacteraceae bacterium]|nr:hypothetical protein [Solirubrobacteraceae bacterium]